MVTPGRYSDKFAELQPLQDVDGSKANRIGESRGGQEDTADQILTVCGIGRTLDVGSGDGALVEALLRKNVDAYGLDVSEAAVSRCNQRIPGRFFHGSVFALPFEDASFQTVVCTFCMEQFAPTDVPSALKEVWRVSDRFFFLKVAIDQDSGEHENLTVEGRSWWEAQCFEAGFRKHPAYYRINPYDSLNHDGWQITILLEKIPADVLLSCPLASLREERDLHMDMLRESGSRSDAHVGRYHFATKFVRPGDTVLDAACGLGYGTHVVHSLTKARSFISIDGSEYAVDYAQLSFGGETLEFRQGLLPDCLVNIPSNSVDHILCFETLEHVQDPIGLLAEFHRVLTPGGRITCSVPNDWSDETGNDPNPFHLHVYNKARFLGELEQFFDIEHLVAQTADRVKKTGGGCVWLKRPRALSYVTEDQSDIEAEWLLAVATKSPLGGNLVAYREQVFSPDELESAGHALAFARDYANPWLVRSLVSIGLRTENAALRKRWAMGVLDEPGAGAADRGAALCVIAYAESAKVSSAPVALLLEMVESYLSATDGDANSSVLRWRVSLMYVGGLLALASGHREAALRLFKSVVAAPAEKYSATLLTKPAEAAYLLGMLLAAEGKTNDAHQVWWDAFKRVSRCLGERLAEGYELRPPPFEVREMASALSLCGRLVAAAANAPELNRRPSVFYDETHADSVFQTQLLRATEERLSNLNRDLLLQKSGFDDLERGKGWLELQWNASEAERSRLQEALTSMQSGKDWLEAQWRASEAERSRLQEALTSLQSSKDWLEVQWRASEVERLKLQEALTSLQSGKDWLESQWKSHLAELDVNQQRIEAQRVEISELAGRLADAEARLDTLSVNNASMTADLIEAMDKAVRLKRSRVFRFAKKLGFFDFF